MEWRNLYRGLIMGASDIIPGVSGGTIAVILGIYDQLIESINGLLSKEWKKHLAFLIPLAIGAGGAILLLARVIKWLFEYYPQPTQFFFLGLILGILPYLFKEANVKSKFKKRHIALLTTGALACASFIFLNPQKNAAVLVVDSMDMYALIFLSGVVASTAMILPGISGSFMLLVLGVYSTVIAALDEFNVKVLVILAVGIIFGLLFTSKLIHFFLQNYRTGTFAFVIGLVIGSIVVIFPGWPGEAVIAILSVLAFGLGIVAAYTLGKVEYE